MYEKHDSAKSFKGFVRLYLADIIYGGNDGTVTTFAVVSGAAGADLSVSAMLVITVVNLMADGFSMAASSFLASRSRAEAYAQPQSTFHPVRHAFATFVAFIIFGSIPLLGYLPHDAFRESAFLLSAIITGIGMFVLGSLRAIVNTRRWYMCGLENFTIGVIAALVAYYCGKIMAEFVTVA